MRYSLRRLVLLSLLGFWAAGIVVLALYVRSQVWSKDRVRQAGVFLVHELLEETPESARAERLRSLQQHSSVDLALISLDELRRRIGRSVSPGEGIAHRVSPRESWYFIIFEDGKGALAAGPVNPARPAGVLPIGVIFSIVFLPIILGAMAFRVERRLEKVERANQALAVGELSVRVDTQNGAQSDELATSFNTMAERIETLIKSRDELIQAVSHELGSPLSRLRFHVELLETLPEEKRNERLQVMAGELDTLDALVAELLSYVQSDDLKLDCQTFDPTQGLADLAELVQYELPDKRIVEVALKLSPGVQILADQRLFLRAIENLLRNAVRYADGKVRLELTREGEQVSVAVHDDGPGIPKDMRDNVMLPFYRLEADRGREMGGFGLGLAIVHRITERHRGQLLIDTSPLGGASVVTKWPSTIE